MNTSQAPCGHGTSGLSAGLQHQSMSSAERDQRRLLLVQYNVTTSSDERQRQHDHDDEQHDDQRTTINTTIPPPPPPDPYASSTSFTAFRSFLCKKEKQFAILHCSCSSSQEPGQSGKIIIQYKYLRRQTHTFYFSLYLHALQMT